MSSTTTATAMKSHTNLQGRSCDHFQTEKTNYASFAAATTTMTRVEADNIDNPTDSSPNTGNFHQQNDMIMDLSDSIRNRRKQCHHEGGDCRCHRQERHRRRRPCSNLARDKFDEPSQDALMGAYECAVTTSVMVYWVFVSLVPVYNKFFFQKSLFPYPIATAGIQLAVVSLVLACLNTVQHCCWHWNFGLRRREDDNGPTNTSWIFGPHFFWKVKWCFPIGFLFGTKYAVSNLGLHLISAPTHLLLQSTDLVWTVLGAWLINGEVINGVELLCLIGCVSGSLVLGWQVSADQSVSAPFFAILINLISPMLLGLCIATLRLACVELMRPDNRVGGTVSSVELTSIKLMMSSSVALVLACFLEGGQAGQEDWKNGQPQIPWWTAFSALPPSTKWGVIGGAGLIAVFQANCTFLTFLTNAVTVGLCGQVKIIPQWITATIFATKMTNFRVQPTALLGAVLICSSAAAFAYSNWCEWKEEETEDFEKGDEASLLGAEDELVDDELAPILGESSSTSSTGAKPSASDIHRKHPQRNQHHPPHLFADGDQWGDASIKSSFNKIGDKPVPHGNALKSTLLRTPSISSQGNLSVCDSLAPRSESK